MATDTSEISPLKPSSNNANSRPASYSYSVKGSPEITVESHSEVSDEESQICTPNEPPVHTIKSVRSIITVLLLGEFISNADSSLIMAAAGKISSEFGSLQDANWLSTAYTLGLCATQPMYGKLSEIYGRKPLLLAAYFSLAFGCVICGIGHQLWVVILGRVIGGIGGAGIMTMSSVIITDIVAKREVATWRAYVNISMTLGRSIGGPLGGWLTDTVGWRWSFILQAPILGIASVLVITQLKLIKPTRPDHVVSDQSVFAIRRVDFLGTGLLAASIISIVILFDRGGQAFAWISFYALLFASIGLLTLLAFIYTEKYIAPEPIFDLIILSRPNVVASYLISAFQIAAQAGMMFSVPLYFQVAQNSSTTISGAHFVPAVIGNTLGGLIAGQSIRRTGSYKPILILAGVVASIAYILQIIYWNGNTGIWGSFFILPGGLGTGLAAAATFVSMTARLEPNEIAMATSGFMMFTSFGMTTGVTASNSFLALGFKIQLQNKLQGPKYRKIIEGATSDTAYIASLTGRIREIVVYSFIAGLKHAYTFSLITALLGSMVGITIKNRGI